LYPHEPKKPAVRRHVPKYDEQIDVKSKDKDKVRIPSGQRSNKKINKKKGRHEKREDDNVGLSIAQDSHLSET
jgi:hypothetical protein